MVNRLRSPHLLARVPAEGGAAAASQGDDPRRPRRTSIRPEKAHKTVPAASAATRSGPQRRTRTALRDLAPPAAHSLTWSYWRSRRRSPPPRRPPPRRPGRPSLGQRGWAPRVQGYYGEAGRRVRKSGLGTPSLGSPHLRGSRWPSVREDRDSGTPAAACSALGQSPGETPLPTRPETPDSPLGSARVSWDRLALTGAGRPPPSFPAPASGNFAASARRAGPRSCGVRW